MHEVEPQSFDMLPQAPPLSEFDLEAEQRHRDMTRRHFMGNVAKLTAGALIAGSALEMVNDIVSEAEWPPTPARIEELKETNTPETKTDSITFVFGGLGTKNAKETAEALQESLEKIGRVGYVVYPGNDLDIKHVAKLIGDYVRKHNIKELNFYGDSSGGDIMTLALPHLKLPRGTSINRLIYDCTPVTSRDILNQNYQVPEFFYKTLRVRNDFGFFGKLAGQLYSHFDKWGERREFKHRIMDAWDQTVNEENPSLWGAELNVDATDTVGIFAKCLSAVDCREMIYLHPENSPHDDTVVNDITAVEHLHQADKLATTEHQKRRFRGLGHQATKFIVKITPVEVVGVPRAQHASSIEHPREYNLALGKVLDTQQQAA